MNKEDFLNELNKLHINYTQEMLDKLDMFYKL